MTIEEARKIFGVAERNGYVSCSDCPALGSCERDLSGYGDCWGKISQFMSAIENDVVNHPAHYTQGGIECIDAMKAAFGADELAVYCKIAAFKYIWRCEHKNGLEDVKKAVWYLNKYIELKGGNADDGQAQSANEDS